MTAKETWEFAKKIMGNVQSGGMNVEEIYETFGIHHYEIMRLPFESVEKMYGEYIEKFKIRRGDIIKYEDGTSSVVVDVDNDLVYTLTENGCLDVCTTKDVKKIEHSELLDSIIEMLQNM